MGMFYGPVLFNARIVGPKVSQLWSMTSQMLHICFDVCPACSDVETLPDLSDQSLKLFADILRLQNDHSFCFTPTTHAITHLHQNLHHCRPLVNASQSMMERLIGGLAATVKSRMFPEARMLNSCHLQFSLKMMQGGVTTSRNENGQTISTAGVEHQRRVMAGECAEGSSEVVQVVSTTGEGTVAL